MISITYFRRFRWGRLSLLPLLVGAVLLLQLSEILRFIIGPVVCGIFPKTIIEIPPLLILIPLSGMLKIPARFILDLINNRLGRIDVGIVLGYPHCIFDSLRRWRHRLLGLGVHVGIPELRAVFGLVVLLSLAKLLEIEVVAKRLILDV